MQVCKKTIKNYFKYEYNDWVQPALTANGTIGGDSFAVKFSSARGSSFEAYLAFDGNTNTHASTNTPQPQWLIIYNPSPIKVTKFKYVHNSSNYWATSVDIQASKTGEDDSWITLLSPSGLTKQTTYIWDIDTNNECYKYYRFYIKSATRTDPQYTSYYAVISEIELTAQEQIVVNGTEEDYDFYTEEEIYSLPTRINRKYYKYIYQDFIRPNLTANGTMGGDSFAVIGEQSASQSAYYAYDGNESTFLQLFSNGVNETYFYNPKPLKISSLDFTYYPTTWITNGEIYGSNDGVNYDLLITFSHTSNSGSVEINNETPYKYFKIKVLSANGSNGSIRVIADIYELKINAIEQLIIDSTEQDYDFYIDDTIYYAIN